MGNECSATYQAKVSVCHYFCMGNGIVPEKGQCGVLQQSCDMKHGSHVRALADPTVPVLLPCQDHQKTRSEPSITANTPECITY